jgi:hypothetical protein
MKNISFKVPIPVIISFNPFVAEFTLFHNYWQILNQQVTGSITVRLTSRIGNVSQYFPNILTLFCQHCSSILCPKSV